MKRSGSLASKAGTLLLAAALFLTSAAGLAGQKYDVIIAGTSGATDTQSIAHEEFAKRLNATGNWNAVVRIGGVMGETDDVTEQALQGVPVICASDPGRIASFVPDYGVIQMPYVFPDHTYLNKVMETDLYKKWDKDFQAKGLKLVTSNCFSGARSWIVKKGPVRTPADLKGQKIRTIGSPLFVKSVEAMGGIPTAIPWGETYQAIEQGVVDGTEAQIPGIYAMRMYEAAKHISLSEHFLLIGSMVTGTKWFDTLPGERQEELMRIAYEAYRDNQDLVIKLSKQYIDEMIAKAGVSVYEIDKQPFIDAVQPVFKELGYEELLKELRKQMGMD
ncbi:MAG: TRAP transporter substrate-binding protein DctP [Planctomycetota bacterium]|jgi:TRAP-type C4-dicarboxylate transport system substrate-binding protein|nr:TRAP transporter substrate-binding protein DctP [Planctomycetota bacterium]